MTRFVRFCAFLSVLFFASNVFAAGYTCSTTKTYTSCKNPYYLDSGACYNCTSVRNSAVQSTTSQSCSISCSQSCSSSCSVSCGVNESCPTGYACTYNSDTCSGTKYGTQYGTKTGTQSVTVTCNGYYTGSSNSSCTGCSSTTTSTGDCGNYGSCGSYGSCTDFGSCSASSSSCTCSIKTQTCNTLCDDVQNRISTTSCTTETSITGGKRIGSGTKTCNGYYTNTACYSAGESCSGCSSYGSCNVTSYSCSCNSGYHVVGSGSTCTCEPDCDTSKSCSSDFSGYSGTYNECTQNQSSQCYKPCTKTCSGNDTSSCPSMARCTYDTSYQYTGTQYYGGSCSATAGKCPVESYTCYTGYFDNGSECQLCTNSGTCPLGYRDGGTYYNSCTTTAESACYQTCTKTCSGNATSSCPSNATCTYNTSYYTSGKKYYGGSCNASSSTCPLSSFSCNANYYKSGSSCEACSDLSYTDSETDTETITGGTRTRSKSRTCYYANSPAGSTSLLACDGTSSCDSWEYGDWSYSCKQGYYLSGSSCNKCESGYYCTGDNTRKACTSWRANTNTNGATGSTGTSACVCAAGYRLSGSSCTACSPGTYKSANSNATSCSGSCTANYYCPAGSTSATQNACPSSYPYSASGSGVINSCYTNVTRGCTQNNGSTPSGCASVTAWNACSCAGGTYKKYYNGTTSGTTTNETCSKTPKTVTASSNYYVSGATCPSCSSYSSTYTKSDGGSISSSSCYTNITRGCTQNNGSTPSGCASVTAWNACSCAGGTYKKYASGSTSGTTSNETCTKTVKSVSANANRYVDGTTCPACGSSYPYSDGGNISSSSCYTNITRGCTQNNGSTPSGCASVTAWNACSCAGGTYRKYASGSTSGTTSNETCTKTVKTVTASANYYVSGTTCPACGSSYPYSDGGNISSSYCYTTKTNTGSQIACSKPANSVSYACGTCTVSTCDWRDYNGATDTTCTPDNCTQPVSSVTCDTGYYKDGVTCPACTNKPANSSYTGTATSNSCPWSCNDGYNQTPDNQCGQFCGAGITHLHLGNGVSIPLYSSALTSPAINVKWNDTVCYGSLEIGNASGLNVKVGSTTYHAVN